MDSMKYLDGFPARLCPSGSGGYDLPAYMDTIVPAHTYARMRTGLVFTIPFGHIGLILEQEGASLTGWRIQPTVYVGATPDEELVVTLYNDREQARGLQRGTYIATMYILPVYRAAATPVAEAPSPLADEDRLGLLEYVWGALESLDDQEESDLATEPALFLTGTRKLP
jgi:dUTPase